MRNGGVFNMDGMMVIWILGAYVVGATPFGFMAGKVLKGIDIREHGSGNIGATNVFRTLGKPAGIGVFVLDFLKGLVPVLLAREFLSGEGWVLILVGAATILGHNYTFWLGFKGGKGIATSAGVLAGLLPLAVGVGLVVWIVLFYGTKYVAVASMGAAVAIPVTVAVVGMRAGAMDVPMLVFAVLIAVLAVWRHRSNIQRLLAGEENRFGKKKNKTEDAK